MPRLAALLCLFVSLSARAELPDAVVAAACDVAKKLEQCPTCTCQRSDATDARPDSGPSTIAHAVVLRVAGQGPDVSLYVALGDAKKLTHVGLLGKGAHVPDSVVNSHVVVAQPQVRQTHGLVHAVALEATLRLSDAGQDMVAVDHFVVLCWEAHEPMCWSVRVGHESRVEAGRKVLSRKHWRRAWSLGRENDIVLEQPTGELAANAFPPDARRLALAVLPDSPFALRVQLYRAP